MITIYHIISKDQSITDSYVGSTKNFKRRQIEHKSHCYNEKYKNYHIYQFMRDNGGFDNFEFKVLNVVEYHNNKMRRMQEQAYIDLIKPTLNDCKAFLSKEEAKQQQKEYNEIYRTENKESLNEQCREYYKANSVKYILKAKEYVENNKELTKERHKTYRDNNAEKIKILQTEYRLKNAEGLKEQKREYYLKNAETIKEKQRLRSKLKREGMTQN